MKTNKLMKLGIALASIAMLSFEAFGSNTSIVRADDEVVDGNREVVIAHYVDDVLVSHSSTTARDYQLNGIMGLVDPSLGTYVKHSYAGLMNGGGINIYYSSNPNAQPDSPKNDSDYKVEHYVDGKFFSEEYIKSQNYVLNGVNGILESSLGTYEKHVFERTEDASGNTVLRIFYISHSTPSTSTLISTTDPVTVTISGADSNTVASIETSLVTNQTLLANLPSELPQSDTVLYSIKTVDDKGNFVQIRDKATVTLPVDPNRTVAKVVYYLPINGVETGAKEDLDFTVSDDKTSVSFEVSHFSYYGVVYASENSGATTPNPTVPAPPQTPPTNDGSGNTVTPPSTGNNDTTSPTPITPAPQASDLSPVREQLLAQIDQSILTDAQKGALAEQVAFAETAKELEAVKAGLAKLTAPATVMPADLSAIRNQLLAQVDKSDLTDEQKGDLAVLISFAETAEDLDKVKAQFIKLTKPATSATEATKAKIESKNTLPQTGEASSLALTGLGLVTTLASLGLAHRRKAD